MRGGGARFVKDRATCPFLHGDGKRNKAQPWAFWRLPSKFVVKHVAVLVPASWAQIAAHLANAGVPVTLFDLAAKEGDRNGIVKKALTGLKLEPAAGGVARLALISPPTMTTISNGCRGCDLIIEAIAERMDWKTALYERIAPHVAPGANHRLEHLRAVDRRAGPRPARAAAPPLLRHPFLQPAALHAAGRIIATSHTEPRVLDQLETWLTSTLGKGVIRALDTPISSPTGSACSRSWRPCTTPPAWAWASTKSTR